jgi:hypothetical protein
VTPIGKFIGAKRAGGREWSGLFDGCRVSVWDDGKFSRWMVMKVSQDHGIPNVTELYKKMVKMLQ